MWVLLFLQLLKNILKKHCWSLKTFKQWRYACNHIVKEGCCEGQLIKMHFNAMSVGEKNYSVPHFIHEVAKKDSTLYPSETLCTMVMSLQEHLPSKGKKLCFLEDECFTSKRNMLNNHMKELSSVGCVAQKTNLNQLPTKRKTRYG